MENKLNSRTLNRKSLKSGNKEILSFKDAIEKYNDLKGTRKRIDQHFWDVIALTTADEKQKHSVEQQIDAKLAKRELPLGLPYIVVCDPPGSKIGSGGANFLVLQELHNLFGDRLYTLKVLLIHTGGQSRRLPSHSVLGKLFAVAPMGDPIMMLLDIKLLMYQPFISRMRPGVFVTASDDIETYTLESNDENNWSFDCDGFTALAHPSPIEVGITHGVYIIPKESQAEDRISWSSPCLRVLQKPSYKLMQETGAICQESKGSDADKLSEFVYSDSAYFFSHSVSRKLLSSIETINPYKCELDAYGDFLQPLGKNATKSYISTKSSNSTLAKSQKALYDLLHEIPLNLVILKKSAFYHLGTMEEYVHNLTENVSFANETSLERESFSAIVNCNDKIERKLAKSSKHITGVLMYSYVTSNSKIDKSAVLECCDFEMDIEFKRGILSNCQLKPSSKKGILKIPSNMLWHTASVLINDRIKFVTIVFALKDDLKEAKPLTECHKLKLWGRDLKGICDALLINKATALFPGENSNVSLWKCKMFPVRATREGSFLASLSMINRISSNNNVPEKDTIHTWLRTPRMSMEDILEFKSIDGVISYQQSLKEKLNDIKESSYN